MCAPVHMPVCVRACDAHTHAHRNRYARRDVIDGGARVLITRWTLNRHGGSFCMTRARRTDGRAGGQAGGWGRELGRGVSRSNEMAFSGAF